MATGSILIVDDNPANLKVARFALEAEGYEVWTAADAEAALDYLLERRPVLILMDIQLPGMDGLELTRRLKADPATREIVIVAVTAYAMKGDREKALRAGCDGYITKPIDPILLPTQVADHLVRSGHAPVTGPGAEPALEPAPPSDDFQGEVANGAIETGESPTGTRQAVLLIEDNPATRRLYRLTLESAGYTVIEARDGASGLDALRRQRPALIIQDLILPDIDGLELAQRIREELGGASLPILCVSGFLSRLDAARAARVGFAQVLVKPVDPFHLLDAVRIHLTAPPAMAQVTGQGRLLIVVDDDPLERKLAQVWLSSLGFNVLVAADGEEGLELTRREHPAAIVSDVLMPKMDGFALCLAVRRDPEIAAIPVILMSAAYTEAADLELARRVGASALLLKTGGLEGVATALEAALGSPPQTLPHDSIDEIDNEHARRARAQLDSQVSRNSSLLHRSALQEAQLAILAGIAEALSKNVLVDGVLADVLASCLDTAGVSKGALYVVRGGSSLELKHQIGFSDAESLRLRAKFGEERLLLEIASRGRVVAVPSTVLGGDLAQRLIIDAGVTSLLLIPVSAGGQTYGAMLLGARHTDVADEDALAFARVLGAQMGQAVGLSQAFEKLAASELRYRILTENANDAICVLTAEGEIQEVNRRLTEITGYPAEQFFGRHMREFLAPGAAVEGEDRFKAAIAEGETGVQRYEVRKQDGKTAFLEFSTARVVIAGEPLVFSIGRDVTEQVRTQAHLMVSDRMASVGTLAAGIAHEINNPLAVVLGNLELLADDIARIAARIDDPASLSTLKASLRDAREAGERVREIVKDVRTFSRSEDESRGPVDVQQVLESTLRMGWHEIRHCARLARNYDDVPLVVGSESRLGQLFLNLIVNAAQAIGKGRADENEIYVSTRTGAEGEAIVEIGDTGVGMSPETIRRLFTPFFTTKPADSGTGLGLSICRQIVDAHGGRIEVRSQLGAGTTFTVSLPPSRESEVRSAPVPMATVAGRRGRILVVDDDPAIGKLTDRVLAREHEVVVMSSAGDALESIRSGERFDVILCDMMMPVITGMEFHDELLASAPDQAERVIFMTGGLFSPGAREFLDRVQNPKIDKPFKFQDLLALVNERMS